MIKKGLKVMILVGKDKKKEGEIIELDRSNNRAKVKGLNIIKKHMKTTKEKKGGIISKENFINLSNLKIIEKTKENFKGRLNSIDWNKYHNDLPFNLSALSLYKWAPIADELKTLDRKIVLNSMILKWDNIKEEFSKLIKI